MPSSPALAETRRPLVIAAVMAAMFMVAIEATIVSTAMPQIAGSIGGLSLYSWVFASFLLTQTASTVISGKLSDIYGRKPILLLGIAVFLVGSVLCGFAQSMPAMIVFRLVQGAGAGALQPVALTVVGDLYSAQERGRVQGFLASVWAVSAVIGPLAGGLIIQVLSWSWIFWINIPLGLAAAAGFVLFLHERVPRERRPLDIPGAALFACGLVSLLLALNQAHAWGWASVPTLGLLLLAAASLIGFLLWERRASAPMLDLGLFRDRSFSAASVSALLNFVSLNGLLFLMPFYLIEGRGLSVAHAGLLISALPLAMAACASGSGWVSDRVGTALPATLGMGLLALGTLLLTRISPHADLHTVAWNLALAGVGVGVFLSPNNSALMGSAPRNQQGVAGGVRATARNVGNVLGIGIVGAVFNSVLARHTGTNSVSGPARCWERSRPPRVLRALISSTRP